MNIEEQTLFGREIFYYEEKGKKAARNKSAFKQKTDTVNRGLLESNALHEFAK
jgi:hypothetical protein